MDRMQRWNKFKSSWRVRPPSCLNDYKGIHHPWSWLLRPQGHCPMKQRPCVPHQTKTGDKQRLTQNLGLAPAVVDYSVYALNNIFPFVWAQSPSSLSFVVTRVHPAWVSLLLGEWGRTPSGSLSPDNLVWSHPHKNSAILPAIRSSHTSFSVLLHLLHPPCLCQCLWQSYLSWSLGTALYMTLWALISLWSSFAVFTVIIPMRTDSSCLKRAAAPPSP